MKLNTKRQGQVLVAQISGELDHHTAPALAEHMDALLQDKTIRVLQLDLKNLTFMDSSGIGVILGRYKRLRNRGGRICVTNENKAISKIFQISGLYQVVEKIS